MAFGDGIWHWPTAILCLFGALLLQIGTNLVNDYFDFKKGADTAERKGPIRVTQAGLIKPLHMMIGIIITFLLASIVSYFVYQRGGLPIAVIAVTSILSAILYTAGPKPLGYLGLGDIFVFIFFGPVAVAGTYYVQSFEMNLGVILAGIAPGLFSAGILAVNNLRDIDTDRKSNKKTLAVRFGKDFAKMEYLFCMIGACLIPVLVYSVTMDHPATLLCVTIAIFSIPTLNNVLNASRGEELNKELATTGILLFVYSILFSIGWII